MLGGGHARQTLPPHSLTETFATCIDGHVAKGGHASTGDLILMANRTLRIQDEGEVAVPQTAATRTPRGKGQA